MAKFDWARFYKPTRLKIIFTSPSIALSVILFVLIIPCPPCPEGAMCSPCSLIILRLFSWLLISSIFIPINYSYSCLLMHIQKNNSRKRYLRVFNSLLLLETSLLLICVPGLIFIDYLVDKFDSLFLLLVLLFLSPIVLTLVVATLECIIFHRFIVTKSVLARFFSLFCFDG